ncbi:MAG: LysR family transcriptional regulator [Xanthobacteraceae bacterium]|nr:LysR family transcriptional regulator [Xanthobacteraceae bacterium]
MSRKSPETPNALTAINFRQVLTIRHLRLVSTLGRELNMSRCAKILHTSQSAISRGVGEIEDLVGVRLFDRTTRRVRPTSFGKVLIWHAEQIVGQLGRAEAEFRALNEGHIGLDVGVMGGFSPARIVQAIRLATAREPALRIRLHSNFADGLIPDLINGRFNLALTHLDTRDFGNEELTARPLYEDEIGVLAAPGHPLVRRERVSWSDLASERWVLTPVETSTRRIVERNLLAHPAASRRVIVETMETHYVISLVRDGEMLTALPMSVARYFADDLGVARLLPLIDGSSTWTAYVAHRKSRHLSAAEELFIRCLKEPGPEP